MKSLKKLLLKKKYYRVPLVLTETNHLEIDVKLNGIAGRFILDTGASNTCVGLDKADHFHLDSESSDVKAAGAGARDMETFVSDKNAFEIGAWNYPDQKIVLFDLVHVNEALIAHNALPVDGIVGSDILRKGKAIIDYKDLSLYLKK